MFRFTIEVDSKRAAVIAAEDPFGLEGFLNGHTDEGRRFHQELCCRARIGRTSVAPVTARLADETEACHFDITLRGAKENRLPWERGDVSEESFIYWIREEHFMPATPIRLWQVVRAHLISEMRKSS
jgi:hypothetical protein